MKLQAEPRNIFGKKLKKFRKKGLVPGIVYGENYKSKAIFVKEKELVSLLKALKEEKTSIVSLVINDKKNENLDVVIKEVQKDPVNNIIYHIDFYKIPMHKIELDVALNFVNTAPAETKGAVIVTNLKEITLSGDPKKLPGKIDVDLSSLKEIGDSIKVKDLVLPQGVEVKASPAEIIVAAVKKEEEEIEQKPSFEEKQEQQSESQDLQQQK